MQTIEDKLQRREEVSGFFDALHLFGQPVTQLIVNGEDNDCQGFPSCLFPPCLMTGGDEAANSGSNNCLY